MWKIFNATYWCLLAFSMYGKNFLPASSIRVKAVALVGSNSLALTAQNKPKANRNLKFILTEANEFFFGSASFLFVFSFVFERNVLIGFCFWNWKATMLWLNFWTNVLICMDVLIGFLNEYFDWILFFGIGKSNLRRLNF